ncbi:MAG: arsenate reductase ArsC, partial [Deltaproteobacteria bacterium]
DMSMHRSKSIDEFTNTQFDYIVTLCDRAAENCPYFAGKSTRIHKSFPDPSAVTTSEMGQKLAFASVRDDIKEWLIKEFGCL